MIFKLSFAISSSIITLLTIDISSNPGKNTKIEPKKKTIIQFRCEISDNYVLLPDFFFKIICLIRLAIIYASITTLGGKLFLYKSSLSLISI